jgi:T4 RnlA family RNA ligase
MMNTRQVELFNNLVNLTKNNEAFYHQEFTSNGHIYWIFNYRLASYTDFLAPDAIECRGHMFEVDSSGELVALKAWCQEKFWNLCENPKTMDLDLTEIDEILLKADGSLMSSYMEESGLKLKSKGSISSEQAIAAMNWLEQPDQALLFHNITTATMCGWTVNLEYCSPVHRIVIGYMKPHLKVLNARNRNTGEYMTYTELLQNFGEYNVIDLIDTADPVAFVASIPSMLDDLEGFVVRLKSGQRVKIKTDKYLSLHHAKDSVNNPRRLFECILDEGVDDLRGMFATDQVAMMLIDRMQVNVNHIYNAMVKEVETFYEMNKSLDRKDFAIKGKAEVTPMYFGLVMNLYVGKDPEYKAFLKKRYKELGFKDEKIVDTEE